MYLQAVQAWEYVFCLYDVSSASDELPLSLQHKLRPPESPSHLSSTPPSGYFTWLTPYCRSTLAKRDIRTIHLMSQVCPFPPIQHLHLLMMNALLAIKSPIQPPWSRRDTESTAKDSDGVSVLSRFVLHHTLPLPPAQCPPSVPVSVR